MSITPFFHVYHKYVFIMSNISKIKISGTSYNLKDENACKVVELTQAQYDDLPTTAKTSNSLFVITDATAGDLSNYYTKSEADGLLDTKLDVTAYTPTDLSNYYTKSETSGATEISTALSSKADTATTYTKTETDNAITAATSTKQDTLVSGTNIKTINGETLLGEGNITIQGGGGGSITIDTSLDSGSTNAVANSAITSTLYSAANANGDGNGYVGNIEAKEDSTYLDRLIWGFSTTRYKGSLGGYNSNNTQGVSFYCSSINGVRTVSKNYQNVGHFSLVETSAITTTITSSSTDSQVPSAKAVYDIVGNIETLLSKI